MAITLTDYKDGVSFTGAVTASVIVFTLLGGKYAAFCTAADTTNVLSLLSPDGSTYIAVDSETTAAFYKVLDLVPGTYKIVVTTATVAAGGIQKIPYNPAY